MSRWIVPLWGKNVCAYRICSRKGPDLVKGYVHEWIEKHTQIHEQEERLKILKTLKTIQKILEVKFSATRIPPSRYHKLRKELRECSRLAKHYSRIHSRMCTLSPLNLQHRLKSSHEIVNPALIWAPQDLIEDKDNFTVLAPLLVTPLSDISVLNITTNDSLFFSLAALCYLPRVWNSHQAYLLIKSFLRSVVQINDPFDHISFIPPIYPARAKSDPEILTNPLLHYMIYLIAGKRHANWLRDTTTTMYVKMSSNPKLWGQMSEVFARFSAAVDPIVKKTPALRDRLPARTVFLLLMKTRELPTPDELKEVNRLYKGTPLEISRLLACPAIETP